MAGGPTSGRRRTLSDEDKIARGTMEKGLTAAELDEKARNRLLPGPWLNHIPEPQMPLGPVARQKYDDLTRLLFDQGKLNTTARDVAEIVSLMWQGFAESAAKGKVPSASALKEYNKSVSLLNLAQNAPPIAGRQRQKKFALHGFADRLPSKAG